jgi:hypothetical protein
MASHGVGVIPARAGGIRCEDETTMVASLHHGRAFFMRAIDIRRNMKTVPVDHLRFACFVDHIHRNTFAFCKAK